MWICQGFGQYQPPLDLAGWPVFIGPDAVAFAMGFSGAVGVFFGWYPARKASRMEPVEALRVE